MLYRMDKLKQMLDKLDIDLLNIEHYSVGTEWNYRNVNNPYSRIYLITKGFGIIKHHGRMFELHPGGLYLIPCFTKVDFYCPESLTHYYIHFTARLDSGMDILSLFECRYEALPGEHNIDAAVFERLLALNPNRALVEYDARKPIFPKALDWAHRLDEKKPPSNLLETNALLRLLLAVFFTHFDRVQTSARMDGLARFGRVLEYIGQNLHNPLSIKDLARISKLHPTYFSNLFSRLMGLSPVQYIARRRIEESQKILLSTDQTLYQIALRVGFSDEYYFSRTFKKIVGISPNFYRKQRLKMYLS